MEDTVSHTDRDIHFTSTGRRFDFESETMRPVRYQKEGSNPKSEFVIGAVVIMVARLTPP